MPVIKILSWNIKNFVGCTNYGGDNLTVVKSVMGDFYDLIVILEMSIGAKGVTGLDKLRNALNKTFPDRKYVSLYGASGPLTTKGLDRVGVIYSSKTIHAIKRTTRDARTRTSGGRIPLYFDVQVSNGGPLWEFCAWHAPEPKNDAGLIASEWAWIKNNLKTKSSGGQPAIILGDFNADFNQNQLQLPLGIPATPGNPGVPGYTAQITNDSTTLKPIDQGYFNQINDRLTGNLYDNFIVRNDLQCNSFTVLHMLDLIKDADDTPVPPLSDKKITQSVYNLADFYTNRISDHLPVELEVDLQ